MAVTNNPDVLKEYIKIARGEKNGDLLLKGGSVINTISGEIYPANVLIKDGIIMGVGNYEKADEILDVTGNFISPGFIDGHVHVESSMLTPQNFARAVIKKGTTAVVADPHEIANVLGIDGIKYILEAGKESLIDIYVMLPSCVPATHLESSGAILNSSDLEKFYGDPMVIGLGEFMNFPAVLAGDDEAMKKLVGAKEHFIDGHAPGLTGFDLNAYILAGINSDHECITSNEALEKLRLGMRIMIREGTATKNLDSLLPFINQFNDRGCFFATDDRHPDDLTNEGHIDFMVRRTVESSGNIIRAIRMATLNGFNHYSLHKYGLIAPGKCADIAIIKDFHSMDIRHVIKNGKIVVKNGEIIEESKESKIEIPKNKMDIKDFSIERLKIKVEENRDYSVKVIEIVPGQIITKVFQKNMKPVNGELIADESEDIMKLAVIERHKGTGNVGLGFVKGIGFKGVIASTIAHDSHNLIIAGNNDELMVQAVEDIKEMNGGIRMIGENIDFKLPLPVAGLMSDRSIEEVNEAIIQLKKYAAQGGCTMEDPFMTLAFLALPVIPSLKLTDKGLVDVNTFNYVSLTD